MPKATSDLDQAMTRIIRDAIQESGHTHYRLSKLSGVSSPVLDRFVSGKRGITLDTAEKIAKALGFEVVMTKKKLPK